MRRKFYLLFGWSLLAFFLHPTTASAQLSLPFTTILNPFNNCYECNVFNPKCPAHTQLWSQLYPSLTIKSTHGSPDIEVDNNQPTLRLWGYDGKSEGFFIKYDFKPYITYKIRCMVSQPSYYIGITPVPYFGKLYFQLTNGLAASGTTDCSFGVAPSPTGDFTLPQEIFTVTPGEITNTIDVVPGKSYSQLFLNFKSERKDTSGLLIRGIYIDEYRHFDFNPRNLTLACGDLSTRTFTIANPLNITGVKSYSWEIGPGWLYNGQPAPATLSTTTTSIQLTPSGTAIPGNVSVAPMREEGVYEKYTCTVKQNPPATPVLTSTSGVLCNQSGTFAVGPVSGATHYRWEAENANLRINGAPSPALLPAASGTSITITDVSAGTYSSWFSVKSYNVACGYSAEVLQLLNVGAVKPVAYYSDGSSISTETPIEYGQANVCAGRFRVGLLPGAMGTITWTKVSGTYPFTGSTGNFINGNIAASQWITFRATYPTVCGTDSQEFTIWGVKCSGGINKSMATEERFNVYPNPATNSIQLTDHAVDNSDADKIISLYDLGNNLILRIQAPNSQTSINTGNLKRGNYYLEVKTGKDRLVKQVILK